MKDPLDLIDILHGPSPLWGEGVGEGIITGNDRRGFLTPPLCGTRMSRLSSVEQASRLFK